jgi:hypothetical protein
VKSGVTRSEKQRFFEKEMRLPITPDEALRTDSHGRIVEGRPGLLRQTGDDHHLSVLGEIEQPLRRTSGGNRLGQVAYFFGRHELVPRCTEFRQDQKIGCGRFERGRNAVEILGHLSKFRIVLIVPNSHKDQTRSDPGDRHKHKGQEARAHNSPSPLAPRREDLLDFREVHDGGIRMLRGHVGMTGLAVGD